MNKLKLKEVKQEFINRGYTPLFYECKNDREKLLAETKEGYKVVICLYNLKKGNTPNIVSTHNPYSIENIRLWIKINNLPYELVSDKYTYSSDKLILNCLIHGEFKISWDKLLSGRHCAECGKNIAKEKLSLSIQEVKSKLKDINPNIEILSNEYINANIKLKCKCLMDNEIFYIAWRHLARGVGCPKCAIRNQSGENNCNWKGGITPLHEYLRRKINKWKQDSFKKYNYKCDIRKIYDKTILIHHAIKNFSEILQETMELLQLPIYKQINMYTDDELKNIEEKCLEIHYKYGLGICLSEEEHKLFHKLYGRENNTIEQYWEFKENRLKQLT